MTPNGFLQFLLYTLAVLAVVKPLGSYMTRVFDGERTFLSPVLGPIERVLYRLGGVDPAREMRWTTYSFALLAFSAVSVLILYTLQRLQGLLPFNSQGFGTASPPSNATTMTPDLAFNTAVSFATNTNWQSYVPETTMSTLVQMAGLAVQNFVSAAAGIAVAIALARGFARRGAGTIGNFWVDLTRATLYVLMPICVIVTLLLVQQGVPQNLKPHVTARTIDASVVDAESKPVTEQVIAQGPVASQMAIKHLGTNGGGFFNANAAHPYENPTPWTNWLHLVSIFMIGAALTYTFGMMVGDTRQGWALLAAMGVLYAAGFFAAWNAEVAGNPGLAKAGADTAITQDSSGGNMEGKEVRFGLVNSALFATVTTDASCGAVNSMHDSYTPLGGLVPLVNIHLGEVIVGGVGAGLYGMLLFAVLAVFIAGLMVGRTPEYLGKKIEQKEVKMAMLATLVLAGSILCFTSWAVVQQFPKDAWINPRGATTGNLNNSGPHGLAEILYAYSSGTGNNGSAFAGISANTPFYNTTIGLAMLIGRFLMIIPLLAIAGSLAAKKRVPAGPGTFPTHGPLFVGLLLGVVVIVGALTYFPTLSLSPIVEHFQMHAGKLY